MCLHLFVYGNSADGQENYLQLSETVAMDSMKDFAKAIVKDFGRGYLNRSPTNEEKQYLMQKMNKRGFPGALARLALQAF